MSARDTDTARALPDAVSYLSLETLAAVQELEAQVRKRVIDVTFTIDRPASSSGNWWIDVQRDGRVASVEWKPGKGHGVAAPDGGYGEGVDFIVEDAATAAAYVARVLQPPTDEPAPR